MQNPFETSQSRPEEAFAVAAERFLGLLKSFGVPTAGGVTDWSALARPLATQFEQLLRTSQSAGPWFAAAAAMSPGAAGFAAPLAGTFGLPPLGPAAVQNGEAQRSFELLGRLAQLQGQLAVHWSEIASTAARRFVERLGAIAAPPATPDQALKLYELWVSCAEEAYAATVHREDFGRLQAELVNTSAALLVEQRRHAETLVRAFGLPTRNEVDALDTQVRELRRQLAELARAPRASGGDAGETRGRSHGAAQSGPAAPPRAKRPGRRPSGKRARGPRR
jgi:hypothetical protein